MVYCRHLTALRCRGASARGSAHAGVMAAFHAPVPPAIAATCLAYAHITLPSRGGALYAGERAERGGRDKLCVRHCGIAAAAWYCYVAACGGGWRRALSSAADHIALRLGIGRFGDATSVAASSSGISARRRACWRRRGGGDMAPGLRTAAAGQTGNGATILRRQLPRLATA